MTALKEGDRVAYASAPPGAYAGLRTVAADALIKLPDSIGFEQAAATMLKGMTAEFLVHKSGKVQPGDTVLVHAAGGRYRPAALPVARARGRHRHRLCRRRPEVRSRRGQRLPLRHRLPARGCRRPRRRAYRRRGTGRGLRFPSAATPRRPPSPAFAPAARSCSMAARQGPFRRASSPRQRPSPSGLCDPASFRRTPRGTRSRPGRARSSTCWRAARLPPISAGAMRLPTRRRRTATFEARRTTGQSVLIPG